MSSLGGNSIAMQASMLMHNLGTLSVMLNAFSIMAGVGLVVSGLLTLKRYGEMRTFMSHQMTLWKPMAMFFGGVMCLMLPTLASTALRSFWGDGNTTPLAYTGTGMHNLDAYIPVINMFVRLLGVGVIMRAAMLFSRCGGQGGPPGLMSKAMIHMFGGLLCLHIIGTVRLVQYIFQIYT